VIARMRAVKKLYWNIFVCLESRQSLGALWCHRETSYFIAQTLPEESGRICRLRDRKQRRQQHRLPALCSSKWIAKYPQIKRQRLDAAASRVTPGAYLMKTMGAAAIVEVLPPECSKCEGVRVVHERIRSIDQPITTSDQAITQVPVFPRCTGPAGIKAPYGVKTFAWKGEIVGGEECRVLGIGIPMSIEIIDKELRHGGVRIIRKLVDRPAAENAI